MKPYTVWLGSEAAQLLSEAGLALSALGWRESPGDCQLAVAAVDEIEAALQQRPAGLLVFASPDDELPSLLGMNAVPMGVSFTPLVPADVRTRARWLVERARSQRERDLVHLIRTRKEESTQQALALAGKLAAGVSHEIQTALAYTRHNLQFVDYAVRSGLWSDPDLVPAAADALEGINRALETARTVLDLTRGTPPSARAVNTNECVERAVKLTRPAMREQVKLELELGELPPALAAPGGLVQVLSNLMLNGADAAGGGGKLLVRTASDEDRIVVCVADSGPGVAPELAPNLFQPFTTGKTGGNGLGLSISRALVESFGGDIGFRPGPLGGAEFRVSLLMAP